MYLDSLIASSNASKSPKHLHSGRESIVHCKTYAHVTITKNASPSHAVVRDDNRKKCMLASVISAIGNTTPTSPRRLEGTTVHVRRLRIKESRLPSLRIPAIARRAKAVSSSLRPIATRSTIACRICKWEPLYRRTGLVKLRPGWSTPGTAGEGGTGEGVGGWA